MTKSSNGAPPVLRIDLASEVPAYRQLVSGLRALLVAGAFAPGERLPTVRELAVRLGVSHSTVAEAYRVLAEEGWLDLRRKRGAVVNDRASPTPPPDAAETLAGRLREAIAWARAAGMPAGRIANELRGLLTTLGPLARREGK